MYLSHTYLMGAVKPSAIPHQSVASGDPNSGRHIDVLTISLNHHSSNTEEGLNYRMVLSGGQVNQTVPARTRTAPGVEECAGIP